MNKSDDCKPTAATTVSSPMLVEKRAILSTNPEAEEVEADDNDAVEEGVQEEDALFSALEHSEEEKEAKEPHETPVDKALAPTLLKSALETGAIKSDSEEDDEKKIDEKAAKEANDKDAAAGHHSRVSKSIFCCVGRGKCRTHRQ